MSTQLHQLSKLTLYKLKRDYGGAIDIYKLVDSQTDARTGQKIVTTSVYHIRRAIILPAGCSRVRMPSISSANKDFVVGGAHDSNTREFIVDRKDVPGLATLTADDWIVYKGRKYQVNKVESFEFDSGWVITTKELVGEVPQQAFDIKADSLLNLHSAAGA
jgi:hypothetical protein